MLDGFVPRKTDTVSKLGARLDTIADFVLVVVCLLKLLPVLSIPAWLYGWIGIIAVIKNVNIISRFTVQKRFVTVHSVMNKATGALLFSSPGYAEPGLGGKTDHEIQRNPYRCKRLQ